MRGAGGAQRPFLGVTNYWWIQALVVALLLTIYVGGCPPQRAAAQSRRRELRRYRRTASANLIAACGGPRPQVPGRAEKQLDSKAALA